VKYSFCKVLIPWDNFDGNKWERKRSSRIYAIYFIRPSISENNVGLS